MGPWLGQRLGVLGRYPAYGLLWGARITSLLGDAVASITLIIFLTQTDGRGVAVGMLLLAEAGPHLFSPLAGTLADRTDQRRLMLFSECGQGVVMAAIAFTLPPLPLLVTLVFCRNLLTMIFQPAGRSAIPVLVAERDLVAANGLLGAGGQSSRTLGPAIAGLLYPVIGPQAVLGLVAALSLVSIVLLLRLPALRVPADPAPPVQSFLRDARAGFAYLRGERVARVVGVTLFASVLFSALDNVALSFLGADTLGATEQDIGFLFAAPALGLVIGGFGVALWSTRVQPARLLVAGMLLVSLGLLGTGVSPVLATALAFQIIGGFGNALENAAVDTLIQRGIDRHMLGRVFGIVYGGAFIASGLAYAIGGPLLDVTSPRVILLLAGLGVFTVVLFARRLLARPEVRPW